MKGNRVLLVIIAVLLLTNVGMLLYFTGSGKKEEKKTLSRAERAAEMMRKDVGFTNDQVEEYKQLRQRRDDEMKDLNANLRAERAKLMELLRQQDVPDSVVMNVARAIGEKTVPVEIAFYQHFKRVKQICTPEQQPRYDSMLMRIMVRGIPGGVDSTAKGKK
jgi:thiamine biosynthesis lipoprotein ApbE